MIEVNTPKDNISKLYCNVLPADAIGRWREALDYALEQAPRSDDSRLRIQFVTDPELAGKLAAQAKAYIFKGGKYSYSDWLDPDQDHFYWLDEAKTEAANGGAYVQISGEQIALDAVTEVLDRRSLELLREQRKKKYGNV